MKRMKLHFFYLVIAILIMLGVSGCVSQDELNAAIMGEYECTQVNVDGEALSGSSDCWLSLTDIGGTLCIGSEEYNISWYYSHSAGGGVADNLMIVCSDITRRPDGSIAENKTLFKYNATYQKDEIRLKIDGKEYVFSKR